MSQPYYAHNHKDQPPEKWHLLENHLKATAEKAREFAAGFGADGWAYPARL